MLDKNIASPMDLRMDEAGSDDDSDAESVDSFNAADAWEPVTPRWKLYQRVLREAMRRWGSGVSSAAPSKLFKASLASQEVRYCTPLSHVGAITDGVRSTSEP